MVIGNGVKIVIDEKKVTHFQNPNNMLGSIILYYVCTFLSIAKKKQNIIYITLFWGDLSDPPVVPPPPPSSLLTMMAEEDPREVVEVRLDGTDLATSSRPPPPPASLATTLALSLSLGPAVTRVALPNQ